jgi:trimethylamine:corrinoid methyltransferase-like protein
MKIRGRISLLTSYGGGGSQMSDFFNDQKRQVAGRLKLLNINDCKDIHMATLQVLEKTGIFVEDQQARELCGSCGALHR